jgi:elongation factor G
VIVLEKMVFPEPVISQAVEPKTKVDQEKMGIALNRLAQEDPSFRVHTDEESGQTIMSGMGELHLEILVDRMRREFGVEASVGKPQVAYRETIQKAKSRRRGQVRQAVGRARAVWPRGAHAGTARRRARATNSSTRSRAAWCRASTFPRSTRVCRKPCAAGVLAGYPVVDVKATLTFGSYHDVDSNENAFRMAGSIAFKDGMRAPTRAAGTDDAGGSGNAGRVHGQRDGRPDGAARHGAGHGRDTRRRRQADQRAGAAGRDVRLLDHLRSLTQGRATYTMEFKHYAAVPKHILDQMAVKGR